MLEDLFNISEGYIYTEPGPVTIIADVFYFDKLILLFLLIAIIVGGIIFLISYATSKTFRLQVKRLLQDLRVIKETEDEKIAKAFYKKVSLLHSDCVPWKEQKKILSKDFRIKKKRK